MRRSFFVAPRANRGESHAQIHLTVITGCSTRLLGASVGILIVPVTIQMISRFTALIPAWIWTEEMARFLFIWMVMLGAMIGVRDGRTSMSTYGPSSAAPNALLRIVSPSSCCCSRWSSSGTASSSCSSAGTRLRARRHADDVHLHRLAADRFTWLLFGGERLLADIHFVRYGPSAGDEPPPRDATLGQRGIVSRRRTHRGGGRGARGGGTLSPQERRTGPTHSRTAHRTAPSSLAPPPSSLAGGLSMTGAALTPAVAAMWLFGTFFFFLILRVPVAFALGLACLPVLFIEPRLSPMVIFNTTFKAYNSFILLAVPFFLLTANLMNVGGITDRLVTLSRTMVGNFPGSLAQINVLLSVFFAGISGSSTADAASQGKIFIEAQVKEGYDLSFSIAITAVSAVLAVIIPPSILMIVWGGVLSVSIGALYLAGVIPGLLYRSARRWPPSMSMPRSATTRPNRARHVQGIRDSGRRFRAGADDAFHHRRRHPARVVHGDGVRGGRRAVCRGALDLLLP